MPKSRSFFLSSDLSDLDRHMNIFKRKTPEASDPHHDGASFRRDSTASEEDVVEYRTRSTLGILRDKKTDSVPGEYIHIRTIYCTPILTNSQALCFCSLGLLNAMPHWACTIRLQDIPDL